MGQDKLPDDTREDDKEEEVENKEPFHSPHPPPQQQHCDD
jgi:hypothetical protein